MPTSWVWSRLSNCVFINPRNDIPDDTDVSFVAMKDITEGYNNIFCYEVRKWKDIKNGFTHFAENDVCFAKITPCFQNRKSAILTGLLGGYGAGTTEIHILRPILETILPEYLLWFVKTPYFIEYGKQHFSGTAGQERFGTDELKNILIPIPPKNEQLRIITQISKVFEQLKDEG